MGKSTKALLILLLLAAVAFGVCAVRNELCYIEYTSSEQGDVTAIRLGRGDELVQRFDMPYDILSGISFKLQFDAQGDASPAWTLSVCDAETGACVAQAELSEASPSSDGYSLTRFDNISLKRGRSYEMRLAAEQSPEGAGASFFRTEAPAEGYARLRLNGSDAAGSLCVCVYGGMRDFWGPGFILFLGLFGALILARLFRQGRPAGRAVAEDRLLQAMLLIAFLILIQAPLALRSSNFTDEYDNIRGGMVIAHSGAVLYRDYVTQHTPIVYYLCALFAKLGASTATQFRICYYVFEALIWGGLYYRHADCLGRWKMIVLPTAKIALLSQMFYGNSYMILSDGLQGLCTVALLLELFRYWEDGGLGWDRCAITSACVWGSIGAAFISVYALVWVVLAVLLREIAHWRRAPRSLCAAALARRYYKLLIMIFAPLCAAILYFSLNHSLRIAFEQAYLFNREVYPKYRAGFGTSALQPFLTAVQCYFGLFADGIRSLLAGDLSRTLFLQMLLMPLATACLLLHIGQRDRAVAAVAALVMIFSATRGYNSQGIPNFHSLPAWYVVILAIVFFSGPALRLLRRLRIPALCLGAALVIYLQASSIKHGLMTRQFPVQPWESQVVSMTEDGEDIFIDALTSDSLYLLYKNHYPVNRMLYFLPWYTEWYEQSAIDDLNEAQPRLAVLWEDFAVEGRTYGEYAEDFIAVLHANYTQADDPRIWIRNK